MSILFPRDTPSSSYYYCWDDDDDDAAADVLAFHLQVDTLSLYTECFLYPSVSLVVQVSMTLRGNRVGGEA